MDGSPIDMGMLPSGTSASNPRAAQVRIEAASASRAGGQRAHDLRLGPQPSYVDADRTPLNRVLIQPWTGVELRRESERRRAQRPTKRAMKSNAGVGIRGIITFGHEAQTLFEQLSPEEQDAAYRELAEAIARRLGTTLTGLVVHADESAPHAHFQLVGYDENGTPISTIAKRGSLRELQDLTAEVMGRHCPGVERGHSKIDRLQGGARPADVVHWSVAELHDRLPTQIAELRARVAELEGALATAEEKARKNEALAQKAIAKARAAKTADDKRAQKAQRNIEAYERRAHAAREEAQALRGEVDTLEARVGKLNEKAELHAREETRLGEKQRELDRRQAEIDGAQETADAVRQAAETDAAATRRAAEDDAGAIRDKAAGEVLVRTAEIAAHEQTSRDKIARQEHALAKRHAGEDECTAIDRECVETLRDTAEQEARRVRDAAERSQRVAERMARRETELAAREAEVAQEESRQQETAAWVERGVSNLPVAIRRVLNGTHDKEILAGDMADAPQKFSALKDAAPEGRPTLGFRARFWSLNHSDGSGPAPLPERIRSAFMSAFDHVSAMSVELQRRLSEAGRLLKEAKTRYEAARREGLAAGRAEVEAETETARQARADAERDRAAARQALDAAQDAEARREEALAEHDRAREETGRLAGLLGPYRRAWDAVCAHKHALAEMEADRERPRSQDLEAARAWLDDVQGRDPHTRRLFDISCHAANPEGWRWLGFDPAAFPGASGDPRAVFDRLRLLGSRERTRLNQDYQNGLSTGRLPPAPGWEELIHRVAVAIRRDDPDGHRVSAEPPPEAAILLSQPEVVRRALQDASEAERKGEAPDPDDPPRRPR